MDSAALRSAKTPPESMSNPLVALWHAAQGEWDKAHALVQEEETAAAAWVHAYLHRVEGDLGNARYWYHRAGKVESKTPTDEEWKLLTDALLLEGGW